MIFFRRCLRIVSVPIVLETIRNCRLPIQCVALALAIRPIYRTHHLRGVLAVIDRDPAHRLPGMLRRLPGGTGSTRPDPFGASSGPAVPPPDGGVFFACIALPFVAPQHRMGLGVRHKWT